MREVARNSNKYFFAAWLIGMAALTQCKHIKQLVLAAPYVSKGPLMAANTQVCAWASACLCMYACMLAPCICMPHLLAAVRGLVCKLRLCHALGFV